MNCYEIVYVDKAVLNCEVTSSVLERLAQVPIEFIDDPRQLQDEVAWMSNPIGAGKRGLVITKSKGKALKTCPGARGTLCCNYTILDIVQNCPLDCSYCILQGYFTNPFIVLYANVDEVLAEVDGILNRNPRRLFRIGTGEFTDSLALEGPIPLAAKLVSFFADKENALFELKTKAVYVDSLLGLNHRGRILVSWSLNPQAVIDREEVGVAPLAARLEAARRCQEAGYKIGFHFDPIIYYPDWERDYRGVVDRIFELIDPRNIPWISLGTLRLPPGLKPVIKKRFPYSKIIYEEMIPGAGGKLRYPKPVRVQMYRKMVEWIHGYDPDVFVYLCMEGQELWPKVFDERPKEGSMYFKVFDRNWW